jgi:hypothetical protein
MFFFFHNKFINTFFLGMDIECHFFFKLILASQYLNFLHYQCLKIFIELLYFSGVIISVFELCFFGYLKLFCNLQ